MPILVDARMPIEVTADAYKHRDHLLGWLGKNLQACANDPTLRGSSQRALLCDFYKCFCLRYNVSFPKIRLFFPIILVAVSSEWLVSECSQSIVNSPGSFGLNSRTRLNIKLTIRLVYVRIRAYKQLVLLLKTPAIWSNAILILN